jgi:hypothetical protein
MWLIQLCKVIRLNTGTVKHEVTFTQNRNNQSDTKCSHSCECINSGVRSVLLNPAAAWRTTWEGHSAQAPNQDAEARTSRRMVRSQFYTSSIHIDIHWLQNVHCLHVLASHIAIFCRAAIALIRVKSQAILVLLYTDDVCTHKPPTAVIRTL